MAVVSFQEVIGRSFQHRFGESPSADRKFLVLLDDPDTDTQEIIDTVNIFHGDAHPEYSYLLCYDTSVSEGSPTPYHAEVTLRYASPRVSTTDFDTNPLSRPDVWSFSTGGAAVPALAYYSNGNTLLAPLVNSAGDFFEGMMAEEPELRATISGNRLVFPIADAIAVTGAINSDQYLEAAEHTWKCAGISAKKELEIVGGSEVSYWAISVELLYRQSGWNLLLPNVGYNYIDGGEKKRAYVMHDGEMIPSANPLPLTSSGGLKSSGEPTILNRRVCKEVSFTTYFGIPTF